MAFVARTRHHCATIVLVGGIVHGVALQGSSAVAPIEWRGKPGHVEGGGGGGGEVERHRVLVQAHQRVGRQAP